MYLHINMNIILIEKTPNDTDVFELVKKSDKKDKKDGFDACVCIITPPSLHRPQYRRYGHLRSTSGLFYFSFSFIVGY